MPSILLQKSHCAQKACTTICNHVIMFTPLNYSWQKKLKIAMRLFVIFFRFFAMASDKSRSREGAVTALLFLHIFFNYITYFCVMLFIYFGTHFFGKLWMVSKKLS
jgi:hypothetical protein